MYVSNHLVGDVGIRCMTNVYLEPSFYFPEYDGYEASLVFLEGIEAVPLFDKNNNLEVVSDIACGHEFRQLMCYLADFNSDVYSAVHGCGLVIDGHGLLIVGNRGSGKTTIMNMFPDAKPIDDDLLIVDDSDMYVSGNIGSITVEADGMKSLKYLDDSGAVKRATIDTVLLLDKKYPGGYSADAGKRIPRLYSVLDALYNCLQNRYLSLDDIEVDSDVFVIGTNGEPDMTRDVIGKILQR